jgi:pimeloyl-ACP methyl ester carboxylesterase
MSPKSGRIFHELLPFLAGDRTAIAPDYPGHGESSPPPSEPHVTIPDFAETVWQIIDDRIGGEPIHFVGHHTGSMVAIEATLQRPDRVISIVNIAAPVFTDEELETAQEYFEPIPIDEDGTRFRIMWERIMFHRGPGMTLQMAADSMAENLRAGDDYEWGHRAAFCYASEYVENIASIRQPVFIMNPNDDTYEQSRRMDSHLQNGRRTDYPEWGHGFLNAYPASAAEEILNFINEVESGA